MVQEINIFASQKVIAKSDSNKINITLAIDSRPIETSTCWKVLLEIFHSDLLGMMVWRVFRSSAQSILVRSQFFEFLRW